jgi:hypothetical protein
MWLMCDSAVLTVMLSACAMPSLLCAAASKSATSFSRGVSVQTIALPRSVEFFGRQVSFGFANKTRIGLHFWIDNHCQNCLHGATKPPGGSCFQL